MSIGIKILRNCDMMIDNTFVFNIHAPHHDIVFNISPDIFQFTLIPYDPVVIGFLPAKIDIRFFMDFP